MKIVDIPDEKPIKRKKEAEIITKGVQTDAISRDGGKSYVITPRNMARRYSSEKQLESLIDWEFKEGNSYHIISQGDIDSLTFLRHIIKQQVVKELTLSTWCMAISDILEIESWIKNKRIGIVHFCCGEIFKGSYIGEYAELKRLEKEGKCTFKIFKNHSKVMVGHGEKFSFVIESSANVNTNPRCENTVITIDKNLCQFYIDFYNGITTIDHA